MPIFLGLTACAAKDKDDGTVSVPASTYEDAATRLMPLLDHGWVVSHSADGTARDQGDSLIFTGIAMGVLDCERGAVPEAALQAMLVERHGGVYRHPSLPDDYSLDGLLGLWWGIDARVKKCPEAAAAWAPLLTEHQQAVSVEPVFDTALKALMARMGLASMPSIAEQGRLGAEVGAWAIATVSQRAAGYRLHLGFLALSLIDAPKGKDVFCQAAQEAKIALIERFCGRQGLAEWTASFAYDRFVYAFQRAAWEGEENHPGLVSPAVDLLIALKTQ